MQFSIAENPGELEAGLRDRVRQGFSARILSSYNRKWITADTLSPHNLPLELQDFNIVYSSAGTQKIWAKPWNYVPSKSGDYTLYVQAAPGSAMAVDPLCEVGCPYAVRGFDFDYVGLLWGKDLVWRRDRWIVQPQFVFETGIKNLVSKVKREADLSSNTEAELLNAVWQSYRILLTRPVRGITLWVEDEETKSYLSKASGSF